MLPWTGSVQRLVKKYSTPLIIFIFVFAYFEYVTLTQYWSHHFYLADIGVFDGILANTVRGKFLVSPISEWFYLPVHFSIIFLFLVPIYLIFDHILTLATIFNLALVGTLFPLYFFALSKLRHWWLAAGFALAYVFNHFVLSMHLALHLENLLMPAIFTLFLAVEKQQKFLYWIALCWALLIKEDIAIYLAAYGIYLAFFAHPKHPQLGLATLIVAISWFIFAVIMMVILRPETGFYKGGTPYVQRFASFGSNWQEIFLFVLTHPWVIVIRIFGRTTFWWLMTSVGFLPLLHLRSLWLIFVPALLFLTMDFEPMYKLLYYYAYPFIPFLFLSAIEGAALVINKWEKTRYFVMTVLFLLAVISFLLPTRTDRLKVRPFEVTGHHRLLKELIKEHIPPSASVAAQYELFCQIPHRFLLLPLWVENLNKVEYAIIDVQRLAPDLSGKEKDAIINILSSPPFKLKAKGNGYYIFHKEIKARL